MTEERLNKLEKIFEAADNLCTFLGYHGEVCTHDKVANDLLSALNALGVDSPHQITAQDNLPVERKTPSVKEYVIEKIELLKNSFITLDATFSEGDYISPVLINISNAVFHDDIAEALAYISELKELFGNSEDGYDGLFNAILQDVENLLAIAGEKLCQKN